MMYSSFSIKISTFAAKFAKTKETMSRQKNNTAFQMIADIEGDYSDLTRGDTPEVVPVLPVRNLVLFPGVVSPILIGRESSKLLIQKAEKNH